MATVIHNAAIATIDDSDTVRYDAAIAVDGDRIAAIGGNAEILSRYPTAERVNGSGNLVMPGFANAHTHLTMTLARGVFEDLSPPHKPPFSGGLSPIPMPKLTPDEQRTFALLGALEALRSGTTLVLEDGADTPDYADALADTGLRLLLGVRAWDRTGTEIGDPAPYRLDRALGQRHLKKIEDAFKQWNGKAEGRLRIAVSAWAPDMCSPELLRELSTLQKQLGTWATIHLNQIWGEVAAIQAHRNCLPTEYLADLGFLNERVICAHCRCMDPREEKLLGQARATVSFNSAIAARRGLSPRIADLESHGCTIAMGSDNMAEDMVEVMRTGLFMERVRRENGREPTPEQALRWATRNGYRALGVPDGGWLAPGNKADLIVVDLHRAHLVPVLRVVSDFVHNGQPRDVQSVMVDGKWLMKDNEVLVLDEDKLLADAQRIAQARWAQQFKALSGTKPPAGFDPAALPM
ncbi:MAG TPA: amidohydrolase family protein [Reyranella sp.]|nr:amidohydrolase family protein [Reyranella sp.]